MSLLIGCMFSPLFSCLKKGCRYRHKLLKGKAFNKVIGSEPAAGNNPAKIGPYGTSESIKSAGFTLLSCLLRNSKEYRHDFIANRAFQLSTACQADALKYVAVDEVLE